MKHIITLLLLLPITLMAQTRSVINIGANPNDGTGDTLRTAMQKSNTNFLSLWETVFTNGVTRLGSPINLSGNLTIDGGTNDHSLSIQDMANTSIEGVNADYTGIANLFLDGGEFTLRANTNLYVLTPEVMNLTATAGDLLSLEDPLSGKVSFQSGIPTAVTNLLTKTAGFVSVREFGAIPNDGIDDTVAIQAAFTSANASKATVLIPSGTYNLTNTIQILTDVDADADSRFLFSSSYNSIGVLIGPSSGSSVVEGLRLNLPSVNKLLDGGFGTNAVGVRLSNLYACKIRFQQTLYWNTGVWFGGIEHGFAYNTIELGRHFNNLVNIKLQPQTTNGWCNENTFIGGSLNMTSNYGARAGSDNGSRSVLLQRVNNNRFYGLSMEGHWHFYQIAFVDAAFNMLHHIRTENIFTTTQAPQYFADATTGQTTQENYVDIGYYFGLHPVLVRGTSGGTIYSPGISIRGRISRVGESTTGRGLISLQNISGNGFNAISVYNAISTNSAIENPNSWNAGISAQGIVAKATSHTHPSIRMSGAFGQMEFGSGLAEPVVNLRWNGGTNVVLNGNLQFNGAVQLGSGQPYVRTLRHGVTNLVSGTMDVTDTNITDATRIFLTYQTYGGTPGTLAVSGRTPGSGFTILSSSGTDTNNIGWMAFEP